MGLWADRSGSFAGTLPHETARRRRLIFGLEPSLDGTSRVSVAMKSEIDQQAFLADPPAALLFNDQLYECPLFAEGEALAKWRLSSGSGSPTFLMTPHSDC